MIISFYYGKDVENLTNIDNIERFVCWKVVNETNEPVFIHLLDHVFNKHQSQKALQNSYVTCCELDYFFLYKFALLWFGR